MSLSSIPKKQRAFCCNYVLLGNISEAAICAGFNREDALIQGVKCLQNPKCKMLISQLREVLSDNGSVISGLKRLAFGNCSDAVYLVFADELPPPSVINKLDLFNVSEIKRIKGGGVEVKLFDRQKALEKLFEFENTCYDRGNADNLIRALTSKSTEVDISIDN